MNENLYCKSVELILANQSQWGSYIASPAFPTYHYCWLRDGSFIAHAMDVAGEYASAAAFFRWVGCTIEKYKSKVDTIRHHLEAGLPIGKDDFLHTRYTLDSNEVYEDSTWGNFQIDGYGTWLWALAEHVRLTGDTSLLKELAEPIQTTLHYLELVWKLPTYDCWEEYPTYLHPYSLASVFAGFDAIAALVRAGQMDRPAVVVEDLALQVKDFILNYGECEGRLVKHIALEKAGEMPGVSPRPIPESGVDSSLVGVALPYQVLPLDDPLILTTIQAIEADLHRPGGGIYRYRADVYYGGGEWLLLSAWLGWYYAWVGRLEQARALAEWIEAQESAAGFLAEQVSEYTLSPNDYEPWLKKWGAIASPLLWSHAMYIILYKAIQEGSSK